MTEYIPTAIEKDNGWIGGHRDKWWPHGGTREGIGDPGSEG